MRSRRFVRYGFGLGLTILVACSSPTTKTLEADRSPASFVDDETRCDGYSDEVSPDQQRVINEVMATHSHRLYHFLWHATRNSWSDLKASEKKAIQTLSPLWGKNAPLCPLPEKDIGAKTSPAGEEFLLMHHQMVAHLQSALSDEHLPCIRGWKTLPKSDDELFPVPKGTADDTSKTDEHGEMMDVWARRLHDPDFLRGKSLSYVGVLVEFTLHNNMHMRWAKIPKKGDDFSPMDGSFDASSLLAPSAYDDPKYNWLGNPYSAHVNPIFWKLHGWVDDTIKIWLHANHYRTIAADCGERDDCYPWKAKWVGPTMQPKTMPGDGNSQGKEPDPGLKDVLTKIAKKAGFGNPKFDQVSKLPRSKAPRSDNSSQEPDPMLDPENFLKQYGPCSGS